MIISDKTRLMQQDKGGSIYVVPPQTFTFSQDRGLGPYEGVSTVPVTPYGKIDFDSALCHATGIEIYFVNKTIC